MSPPPMPPPPPPRAPGGSASQRDRVQEALQAERAGDFARAAAVLRAHLGAVPGDREARLRLGRVLLAVGEPGSARAVLAALDGDDSPADIGPEMMAVAPEAAAANRLLAEIDEMEGALASAQLRWERVLADDVDDPQARARLRALRGTDGDDRGPGAPAGGGPTALALGTLVSPEGLRTARYELVRELGRGATAAVYLVRDERLGIPLAMKVLYPQLAAASRATARARFFAEARVAARLRHPAVVAVYDVDEDSRSLVMEYVAGGTLRDRLRAAGTAAAPTPLPLGPAETLATCRRLFAALAYVHDAGVVHGDLKPGNVLLRAPGEVVLADFGAAELGTAGGMADRAAGTPLYLAPEQFRGAPPSPRTDLYAAGAILRELLTGAPARRHRDLMLGVHTALPLPPDAIAPLDTAGPPLAALVEALLAADPAARPANAAAALAAVP